MEVVIIKALQLILCFSILILLHEGGHFFFAKLFKVRVEKFALFFDPWFTLFKFKPRKSETTYALGWIPLGGYVKIAGMIDESLDKEQLKRPVQPWEFRAKPAWQRLLIMLGGVLVNFVLALFIYAMLFFANGESYTKLQDMHLGMKFNKEAQALGFKDGDILLTANGDSLIRFDNNNAVGNVYRKLSISTEAEVLRQGQTIKIKLPGNLSLIEMMKAKTPFVAPLLPSFIGEVEKGTEAFKQGLRTQDRIIAVNSTPITTWNEYNVILNEAKKQNEDSEKAVNTFTFVVERAKTNQIDTLLIQLDQNLRLAGLSIDKTQFENDPQTEIKYSFLAALPAGAKHGWEVVTGYVSDLKYLFTADGVKNMGSFITIGNLFPSTWDWTRFWEMTAFISLILAVMNILPIPALDGGHVLMLLYEIIRGKAPSEKFLEYAQQAGMLFLFLLMAFALLNDFLRIL